MAAPQVPVGSSTRGPFAPLIALARWARLGMALAGGLILLALWVGPNMTAPPPAARPASHVALDIMPVRPGGPAHQHAAYLPSTSLRVPARSVISVTIRNFDLDATPVSADSPYTRVWGTVDGVAYADNIAYKALASTGIAHTFTIPQLHLNVPIPGRSMSGKPYVEVTFSFRTSAAGAFHWRCFDPCGDGTDGLEGAMADEEYMRGTLTVEP